MLGISVVVDTFCFLRRHLCVDKAGIITFPDHSWHEYVFDSPLARMNPTPNPLFGT